MDNFNVLFVGAVTLVMKLPFHEIFNLLDGVQMAIFLVLHLLAKTFTCVAVSVT